MRYLSVCAGIEAATVAWHHLGWEAAAFSEIEAFPRAVLAHHYPDVPLHGDFTTIKGYEYGPIDLLVGGTPCQSFSIAGLRGGLDDDRGNLALEFLRLAQRTRPKWLVWENVPGVLSSNGGRDFGSIIGGMVECGYGIAYRVLDAQYFGVPQRRRRVFVVGCLGDAASAAAVLFERQSLCGNSPPRRKEGQGTTASLRTRAAARGGQGDDGEHTVAHTLPARSGAALCAPDIQTYLIEGRPEKQWPADVACTMNSHFGSKQGMEDQHALGGASYFVPGDAVGPLTAGMGKGPRGTEAVESGHIVAFDTYNQTISDVSQPIRSSASDVDKMGAVLTQSAVRRLTPRECERLQGFPDDYTLIPYRNKPAENCPDGPRYKALGNSMAVPVMRWIGERIQMVEELPDAP